MGVPSLLAAELQGCLCWICQPVHWRMSSGCIYVAEQMHRRSVRTVWNPILLFNTITMCEREQDVNGDGCLA